MAKAPQQSGSPHLHPDSRVTGWSHNVYETSRLDPDATATRIAKQFIPLIDEALRKKNLHVLVGSELEFDLKFHDLKRTAESLKKHGIEVYSENSTNAIIGGVVEYFIKRARKINQSPEGSTPPEDMFNRMLRSSAYSVYKDIPHFEIATKAFRPLDSADTSAMWKKFLFESTYQGFKALTGKDLSPLASADAVTKAVDSNTLPYEAAQKELIKDLHMSAIRCAPEQGVSDLSEHINVSFNIPETSGPTTYSMGSAKELQDRLDRLPKGMRNITPFLGGALQQVYDKYLGKDLLLLYNGPASINRHYLQTYQKSDSQDNDDYRVEMKAPDCASNSHLAVLLAMAQSYAAIKCTGITKAGFDSKYDPAALGDSLKKEFGEPARTDNSSFGTIKDTFKDSLVIKVMREIAKENNIEQSVVDTFEKAVNQRAENLAKNPPGIAAGVAR